MNEFEPKQFGKYYLLEKLAVGGMAEIYKAKTFGVDGFEKELAIKRILPHCSADKDFITMLIDEAKLSVLLSHANIVQVYDLGKVGDDYFISMEFIHGVNLRDLLYHCREEKIPIPTDVAVYIVSELCKGLDYAHRKTDHQGQPLNIVHRDISPQNILLSYEGEVKIVDFGIAKAAMNISHTMAGILKGKIAYMSPEQAMGKSIDSRTDIFSTGILLYEMITGTKLYTGESQFEVLKKIRTIRITPESLPDSIPAPLKPVVAKALAYNIDNRYQNAGDLQIDLTKHLYSTYSDFSPRKLAAFIREAFGKELKTEQIKMAREAAFEQQTSSMNIGEGAKQMEIVHREQTLSKLEPTASGLPPSGGVRETLITQAKQTEAVTGVHETEDKTTRKRNRVLPVFLISLFMLSVVGYLLYRYVPAVRFWQKSELKPQEIATQPLAGSVNITSIPSGAQIFIDGEPTGKPTPSVIENFAIGKSYTIRLEKENYTPVEKSITVASAERVDVALTLPEPTGVLNIISEPPGAAILIEGKLTGLVTPATLEKIPLNKDQRITLSKPEYEDFEQVINLTSSKPQKISTSLKTVAPKSGKMVITSTPAGASVVINGKDTEKTTPASFANLEPGKYEVKLDMAGYENWTNSFNVESGKSIPVDAVFKKVLSTPPSGGETTTTEPTQDVTPPVTGKSVLHITSKPDGAKIILNGRATGQKTPANIGDLKVGSSYNIRFDLEGYKSITRKKSIRKESETLFAELAKEQTPPPGDTPPPGQPPATDTGGMGTIRVASNPSGADVFINSEHKGKTPLTVSVPAGPASVLVNKEGTAKASRQVTVKPGQTVNITDIELGDLYGEVSLTSDPPRAQVIFDGQAIPAPTPVTVRKVRRDQPHSVTIQLPGYRPWSKSFTMDSGSKSFSATLQPQ